MSNTVYKSYQFNATATPDFLKKQYAIRRYQYLKGLFPFVPLDHNLGYELDHLDAVATTSYIMATRVTPEAETLIAAMRLIPTLCDYEIEKPEWGHVTEGIILPKERCEIEGSRWIGASSRTMEGTITSGLLHMMTAQYCRDNGYTTIVGVTPQKWVDWLDRRGNVGEQEGNHNPAGDPYKSVFAKWCAADLETSGRSMLNSALDNVAISNLEVCEDQSEAA